MSKLIDDTLGNKNYTKPINLEHDLNVDKIAGEYKGIQGNVNSCYLDSLLMAMFPFTNVFDYILLNETFNDEKTRNVKDYLHRKIVNPLRK